MPSASNWVQLNGTSVDVGTTLTITATQTSQSIANNTSVITLTYTIASGKNWGDFYTPTNTYMTPTIDGVAGTRTQVTNPATLHKGESAVVLTTTHTVTHDSDGKKTVSISVFYDDRPGGGATTKTVSTFYLTLDTIARKSTMTATNATMGNNVTFSITSASSSFTHAIYASCGSWNNGGQPVSYGGAWTVPDLTGYFSSSETSKTVSFTLYTYSGSTAIGSSTASCTISMPGKNTGAAWSGTLGSSKRISFTKAYSSYKTTVQYFFGSASGTLATQTSNAYVDWAPAASLGGQIPSAMSGTGTLRIITYANSTSGYRSIGQNDYTLTLSVPDYSPSVSFTTARIKNDNSTIAGWGVAVKGYTKYEYAASGSSSYGATISSYSFSCGGRSKSGASGTTDAFTTTGSSTPTIVVTDSRGKTKSATATSITIYDYGAPVIISSYAYRSDANGNRKDDGTYVANLINAKTDYTCGGKNSISVQWRWKESTGSWSSWYERTNNTPFTSSGWTITVTYQEELRVIDSLGGTKSVFYTIPTAFVTEVEKAGGHGVGFFGYPQIGDNTVEVFGKVQTTEGILLHNNELLIKSASSSGTPSKLIYSYGATNSNTGWFNVARKKLNDNNQIFPFTASLSLCRQYSNAVPEAYTFSLCQSWTTGSITQLSGYYNYYQIDRVGILVDSVNHYVYISFHVAQAVDNFVSATIEINSIYSAWGEWETVFEHYPTANYAICELETKQNGLSAPNIYVGNHSSPIGSVLVGGATLTLATSTTTKGAEIELPAGKWLVQGMASFNANTAGAREVSVNIGAGASWGIDNAVYNAPTIGGEPTRMQVASVFDLTSKDVARVWVWQNSGYGLGCITYVRAIRLQ